jgi:acyl-CoA thioesterase FadM
LYGLVQQLEGKERNLLQLDTLAQLLLNRSDQRFLVVASYGTIYRLTNTVCEPFTPLHLLHVSPIRHPALVHGGVTALTFDNLLGWLSFLDERPNVLTAYLHVDFKAPLPTATTALVEVHMEKQEGRKLFFVGSIKSLDGVVTYSTCTSLFVVPKDQKMFEKQSHSNSNNNDSTSAPQV